MERSHEKRKPGGTWGLPVCHPRCIQGPKRKALDCPLICSEVCVMNKVVGFVVLFAALWIGGCAGERQGLVCEEIEYRLNTLTYSPDQRAYMENELNTCRAEEAKKKNIEIIDFTCPLVSRIHTIIEEYKDQRYYIFLIGIKNHPVTIGSKSHCGDNYSVIETIEELEINIDKVINQKIDKLLVIVQTTFSKDKFNKMEQIINKRLASKLDLVIKNTICNATEQRQIETEELSKKVDLMIIIGGKNSSNTNKLYDIAQKNTKSILIESEKELDLKDLYKYEKIGIMAGTSTPQLSIDLLTKRLNVIKTGDNSSYNW